MKKLLLVVACAVFAYSQSTTTQSFSLFCLNDYTCVPSFSCVKYYAGSDVGMCMPPADPVYTKKENYNSEQDIMGFKEDGQDSALDF